jgi:radical SAM protein with 4Fe4S-binding SPASM domain
MSTTRPFDFFIQWHLTENCNLSCRHCYQGERSTDEMPLSEIKRTIAEAADMVTAWSDEYGLDFSRSMTITGGEPLLRPDIFVILDEVRKQGFDCTLLTNGTLISLDVAARLASMGLAGVQVSIEGPEEVHDSIRGRGSFAASASGIEYLVDGGVTVTINATISSLNASSMRHIIAFGSHIGVKRIGFSRLVPAGRGRSLISRLLQPLEVKDLFDSVLSLEIRALEIVTGDPLAAQMKKPSIADAGNTAISGCAAGVSGLTILPNGNVTPCRRLPLSLGNVRRDSLREIWSTSPILEALRDRSKYKGKCGNCRHWAHCRGCRAIAYAYSRAQGNDDFLADDPQCFIPT